MPVFSISPAGISLTDKLPQIKREQKGKSLLCFPQDFTVLDLETTGLDPRFDEMIEFAGLRVRNNQIVDSFSTLIQPEESVDSFITELTGITNEMLSSAPVLSEVLPKILQFIGDDIIVGHNVSFDINFLYDASEGKLTNDFVDTLRLSRIIRKDLPNHKLCTLVAAFDIESPVSHRAQADAEQTLQCFIALQQYAKDHNVAFQPFLHYALAKSIVPNTTDFDENCPLFQKIVVFTGTLELGSRRDAMQLVADHGGICADSVTSKTNFLVLGNNDYCKSIKDGKSNKQKQAEKWILKGKDLKIISEQVFLDMLHE